jgi:hypothetical protein
MHVQFQQFLSTDSAKAIKASGFGYLNGINYMAPHKTQLTSGKIVNLCSHASTGCIDLCLGKYSGQASYVKDLENGTNNVRLSRARKVVEFMERRESFMAEFCFHVAKLVAKAHRLDVLPCVRPNGSQDVAWEGVRVMVSAELAKRLNRILKASGVRVAEGLYSSVMDVFPSVQFVDYTKNPFRFDRKLPSNYYLTFSHCEDNALDVRRLLARGVNVAVVFGVDSFDKFPATFHGSRVIDGDKHDLRHLDPRESRGVIVGLTPKGNKAKRDGSGFVIRDWIAVERRAAWVESELAAGNAFSRDTLKTMLRAA